MKPIVYVLKSAGLCGGVRVVLEQVRRLNQRGYEASVYHLTDSTDWFGSPIPSRQFSSIDSLISALKKFDGIKIATWYETAFWLAEAGDPENSYYLIQDIEESYGVLPQQKEWILNTYKLGLKPLTTSQWVKGQLATRFGQNAAFVSLGVDFDKFKPLPGFERDTYRVLTQCRVWTAGPNLKGWNTAKQAVEAAFEEDKAVSLVTYSVEHKQALRNDLPHIHIQKPSDQHLNEIYNSSGLFLLSSTHEGFGLTAAEAMAVGIPVVATKAHGNEEFCFHGKTALMADVGDWKTLSQHILKLFHNQDYATALAAQGWEYIQRYTWDRSIDALEHALFGKGKVISIDDKKPSLATANLPGHTLEYPTVPSIETNKLVSVVIPTVDEVQKVRSCVQSIRNTTSPSYVEIIVVDDGTKDSDKLLELELLRREYDYKLIRNGMNLGFSASVNAGILASSGKYVVLCNNDVTFHSDWVTPMCILAAKDESIAIVGAKLLYPNGLVQHAGMAKVPNGLYFPHIGHSKSRDDPEVAENKYVWSVTGAVFCIKRKALEKLGGLSTAYATAWEDVDYCLHAWSKGWRVAYCAGLEAMHIEGGTRGATNEQKRQRPLMWMEREKAGEAYFMKKWIGVADMKTPMELNARLEQVTIE